MDTATKTLCDSTLLFLVKKEEGKISDICLAMKKRGFGKGRLNGAGGKVEEGESIEDGVIREAREEIGVTTEDLKKVAELSFYFPHNPAFDQKVHVYMSEAWDGTPSESDEMSPSWYKTQDIPYTQMWSDDIYWLPQVIAGSFVTGTIVFGEGDVVLEKEIVCTDR